MTHRYEIRGHRRVCVDRLSGLLQCPVGDQISRDPPARGHHTDFIYGGPIPSVGTAGERAEFDN